MAAPSFDELHDLGKAEAILKRPKLAVRVGDISHMLISAAAAMADRVIGWFSERIAATFLDGAQGDDLTQLAADHWGIQRREATKATAQFNISRSAATATAQTLAIGSVVATARDSRGQEVRYLTLTAASWGISENSTKTVNVEAETAGVAGNLSSINLITRLISSPPAGGTYTITSSTQPAGGSEEEDDATLRDRVRRDPRTLRRGTLYALEYGALTTANAGVSKANAIQDDSGLVVVYVSDASGGSSGGAVEVDPDLADDGLMTTRVAIELLNWACAGSLVSVVGGSIQTVNITVQLTVRIGVDINQLLADVESAIQARTNKLTIGDTLYKSDIISAVKAVDPDNIVDIVVSLPATDTAPTTPGHLIRAGVITVQ